MKGKNRQILLAVFLLLVAGVRIFSSDADWVERYFSTGIYPFISRILKYSFGWLPFSIGDLLYGILLIWGIINLVRLVRFILKRQLTVKGFMDGIYKSVVWIFCIYLLFNILWGINYNRKGITSQLGIKLEKYTVQELLTIDSLLLQKVNESKMAVLRKGISSIANDSLFMHTGLAYQKLVPQYPYLAYEPASVKKSMWGWLGNYLGFMGYYNPFTGEAQVNTTVPYFLLPYTSCHELAHQLGYAKENEANFVGYLAAAAAPDSLFHYSVYLDLFLSANRNLYEADSLSAKSFAKQLLPQVKTDLKEWRKFNISHQTFLEPVSKWLYGKYLQNNQQPSGILTYDEVIGFLIAYHKKWGKL